MIFVTVGTHEQPFNRLIQMVDQLVTEGIIQEEVVIQTGFSSYEPKNCKWSKLIPYKDIELNVKAARVVITHGGPASFIMPLQVGKIPIVVPRKKEFGEHVNDHQIDFSKAVAERMGTIIPVYDICDLKNILLDYEKIVSNMPAEMRSNNIRFNEGLEELVDSLLE